jgi:hypothetical protein
MRSNATIVDGQRVLDESSKKENSFEPHYTWSMKSSPNGIGYFSLLSDITAIHTSNVTHLLWQWASTYYDADTCQNWFDEAIGIYSDLRVPDSPVYTGKLSATQESGKNKPRIFAIVDTITQTLLRDFHDDLMRLLKAIPEDCTYNHDKVREIARLQSSKRNPFYGYADLSDATDSIPRSVYRDVGDLFRPSLGTNWVRLFDRDFHIGKNLRRHLVNDKFPSSVTYNTGQPMGALSSWPFMALVQHILVWNAFGSRRRARGNYLVLGDDIVIFNKRAYQRYLSYLDKLQISYTNDFSTVGFEFAKRYFLDGQEITGAYLSALYANRNDPAMFCLTWSNLRSRSYAVNPGLPKSFIKYIKISKKKIKEIAFVMTVPIGTDISANEMHKFLCTTLGRSWCLQEGKQHDKSSYEALDMTVRLLLQAQMTETISGYRAVIPRVLSDFGKYFDKYNPGLSDQCPTATDWVKMVFEESRRYNIRLLERDYKLLFHQRDLRPNDLLRPTLPDIPFLIDFNHERDKVRRVMKYRFGHQLKLSRYLSMTESNE